MKITETRISLAGCGDFDSHALLGYARIVFDGVFVVHDLKIIEGPSGRFLAFPSKKISAHCDNCGHKNGLLAHFCCFCGMRLPAREPNVDPITAKPILFRDLAHPLDPGTRAEITREVLREFERTEGGGR